jgi:hypothetical protein
MRRASLFLIAVCLTLKAQTPIGMGPGKLVNSLVLGPSGTAYGDTAFTAWLSSAAALPVISGLPVVITGNDGDSDNMNIWQLSALNYSTSTVSASLINHMTSFGGASVTNVPSGWWGYATQTGLSAPATSDSGVGAGWKSRGILAKGGCLYWPIARQINSGTVSDHDATVIKSCDAGVTWANPYTVAHSGTPSATGDAPLPCNASPCTSDPVYMGSMMWLMPPGGYNGVGFYNWSFVQYGQDGSLPTVPGGCDPSIWTCAVANDGTLARVPNASIQDVTQWQYFSGRTVNGIVADGNLTANWTPLFDARSTTSITPALGSLTFTIPAGLSGLANGTRVYGYSRASTARVEGLVTSYSSTSLTISADAVAGSGAHTDWCITPRTSVFLTAVDGVHLSFILGAPAYIAPFKSFLISGWFALPAGAYTYGFLTGPHEWGPWTPLYTNTTASGFHFPTIALGAGYSVVSSNPLVVRLTNITTGSGANYTWNFDQWEFGPGKQPYGNGEVSNYTDIGIKKLNSGWVLGSGETPGTIPRNGLLWAFDFMDHGGDTSSTHYWFGDVSKPLGPVMTLRYYNGTDLCSGVNNSYGQYLMADSVKVAGSGYSAHLRSSVSELDACADQNVPADLTGNGSFTVATVFRSDSATTSPIWFFGDYTSSNTAVALGLYSGANMALNWGFASNNWRFQSTFTPTTANWYCVIATVQANGATPIAHLWTGVGGVLVDEIAGVTRAVTGGTPTQTPNTSAGPLVLALDGVGGTYPGAYSYAGLLVYGRALSAWESQNLYQSLKARMLERGVTVQ